jgi:hypothetical protein
MAAPCKEETVRAIDDVNHEGFLDGNIFDANINVDLCLCLAAATPIIPQVHPERWRI